MSLVIPPPIPDCEDRVEGAISIPLSLSPSTQKPLNKCFSNEYIDYRGTRAALWFG